VLNEVDREGLWDEPLEGVTDSLGVMDDVNERVWVMDDVSERVAVMDVVGE